MRMAVFADRPMSSSVPICVYTLNWKPLRTAPATAPSSAVGTPSTIDQGRDRLSYCKHQVHTNKLEGVNSRIKVLKRVAYGFRDLAYFALKVKQTFPGRESRD